MNKLVKELDRAGLLNPAQKRAEKLKEREAQLRASLKKYDIMGLGYYPKVRNFKGIEELDSFIPFTQECEHSWAEVDSVSTSVKLAIIRDSKLKIIEGSNNSGCYSLNGTVTSDWENRWDNGLEVGDIIIAIYYRMEGYEYNSPVDEEEYILLRNPIVYGEREINSLSKKWEELRELF